MRHALQVERHRHRLIGRDQHLHDIGLVDRHRPAEQVARARGLVIGIDLPQQLVPPGQVIVNRIVGVAGRRVAKDFLEQRRQLAVAAGTCDIDNNRLVAVTHRVISKTLGKVRQPALQRQPHGKAPRSDNVLLHHWLQQLDHRIDARDIARRIGRQIGAAARPDGIGQMPGGIIERRAEHRRLKIDPAQAGRKVELRRGQ